MQIRRCAPSSLLAWLARLQRRGASRRAKCCLHARETVGGEGEKGEKILSRLSRSSCNGPWGRKGEKWKEKERKRGSDSSWGVGQSAKVDRVTHKNDRALDAHHEIAYNNDVQHKHDSSNSQLSTDTEKHARTYTYMCVCAFMYV